jgi:hypothetical protein
MMLISGTLCLTVLLLGIWGIGHIHKPKEPALPPRPKSATMPNLVPQTGDWLQWYECNMCRAAWVGMFDKDGDCRTPDILNEVKNHQCNT